MVGICSKGTLINQAFSVSSPNQGPFHAAQFKVSINLQPYTQTQPSENVLFSPQIQVFILHLPFTSFYIIIPECFYFSFCEITMEIWKGWRFTARRSKAVLQSLCRKSNPKLILFIEAIVVLQPSQVNIVQNF